MDVSPNEDYHFVSMFRDDIVPENVEMYASCAQVAARRYWTPEANDTTKHRLTKHATFCPKDSAVDRAGFIL